MGAQQRRRLAAASLAMVAALLSAPSARGYAIAIVNIDPSTQIQERPGPGQYEGFDEGHGDSMVGWAFTLLQPVTVSRVGWFDDGRDGLSRDFQIGLWSGSTQLLGSPAAGILIPGGTRATLDGVWRVIELTTPLSLLPGPYVLGVLDSATTPDVIKFAVMNGLEDDPLLTASRLTLGAFFYGGDGNAPGFHRPELFYAAGGLELGPMLFINIPEPSPFTTVGMGVVLLRLTIAVRPKRPARS